MKAFDRAVERFCYKHPKFGIPRLILYIIIGQAIVYIIGAMDTTGTFYGYLYLAPDLVLRGQVWRLISFIFVPGYMGLGSILWFAIFMMFYYFIGTSLENQWGTARFTIYYFMGVLLSIIYGFIVHFAFQISIVDVSYINLALFFAFATLWPDEEFLILFILPVKAKWLALVDALFFVWSMISERTLFPLIPILNYLLFFTYILIERIFGAGKAATRRSEFKVKMHQTQSGERLRGYRHKCEVCGRTDVSDPELEFRYCSRCVGYHCFCMDHINDHTHFTE